MMMMMADGANISSNRLAAVFFKESKGAQDRERGAS